MAMRYEAEYLGARATPGLVNREETLRTIKEAVDDHSHPYVIYITGDGGMGKTFLVREVLRRLREDGEWHDPNGSIIAALDVVDLYHASNHSLEGLTLALWKALGPAGAKMTVYRAKMEEFESKKRDLAGMLRELSTLRTGVARAFLEDLNRLAASRRLVIALDTAEKLLYETDDIQKILGVGQEGIAVQPWLIKDLLAKLQNAVVLIAGRPKPEQLRTDLETTLGDRLIERSLQGFKNAGDCSAYFDAVAEAVRVDDEIEAAARIQAIPTETREVIRLYTGGRPILLSLMIDYLLEANQLLPAVKVSLEEAEDKDETALAHIRQKVEAELVQFFQNIGRGADDAIRALAWARKGLDAEMLASIADMDVPEAEHQLQELGKLSFIKQRPADRRVFLHDEMYEMLQRHVLAHQSEAYRERVYRKILEVYEDRIDQARKDVAIAQRMGTGLGAQPEAQRDESMDRKEVEKSSYLYRLMAEEIYYRLRLNPQDGFRAYRIYRKEAFWINDESLDMQLRSEVLAFRDEQGETKQFDGLSATDIQFDAALGWILRFLRLTKYGEALNTIRAIRNNRADLVSEGGTWAQATLDAAEGEILAFLGEELYTAESLLHSAIERLNRDKQNDSFEEFQSDASLAEAWNTLGYLYRVMGRYQQSVDCYREAVNGWRILTERERSETLRDAIQAQHANTLNNLSWALAWVGDFLPAINTCRDALGLRQELGPAAPRALSYNTMGSILVKANHPVPAAALEYCHQALGIFRGLLQPRGVGLACISLAEAYRRLSTGTPDLFAFESSIDNLAKAEKHAAEAVDIFTQLDERTNLMQALIEAGCTHRDWAWTLTRAKETGTERALHVEQSLRAFDQAIEVGRSEIGLLHMVVDAQVNLAWLHFYVKRAEEAHNALAIAYDTVPDIYHIKKGAPPENLPQSFLWVLLSKVHLLWGLLSLRGFESSKDIDQLERLAKHFVLSLEYDNLFSRDFRDMRRALETMYDSLKHLNRKVEFPAIYRGVVRAQEEYGLQSPTHFERFLDQSFPGWHRSL